MTSKTTNEFSPEVRVRAVLLVLDHKGERHSRWVALQSIAPKIGYSVHTFSDWIKKADVDTGKRTGVPRDAFERLKALERENRVPMRYCARRMLILLWRNSTTLEAMSSFIDERRLVPIAADCPFGLLRQCRQTFGRGLPVDPLEAILPGRSRCVASSRQISASTVRKVWRQLNREGLDVSTMHYRWAHEIKSQGHSSAGVTTQLLSG